jgi:vacuolar-type H+-ATPase catalytic subunit A/Vma1
MALKIRMMNAAQAMLKITIPVNAMMRLRYAQKEAASEISLVTAVMATLKTLTQIVLIMKSYVPQNMASKMKKTTAAQALSWTTTPKLALKSAPKRVASKIAMVTAAQAMF